MPLLGELVFFHHRMKKSPVFYKMVEKGGAKGKPPRPAGCLRLLPISFGLGQAVPVRWLAPSLQGERVGWEGLEKPQVDSVTFLLLYVASPQLCPVYHPSVRGLRVCEFPHAPSPVEDFC